MGKFRNYSPKPSSNWTRFDQELVEMSDMVKNKLQRKIEDLRATQRNLEDELASVDYDIEDLKKAKKLVDFNQPGRSSSSRASVDNYLDDLKEAQSLMEFQRSESSASLYTPSEADFNYSRRTWGQTKLFIDNLHYTIKDSELKDYFSEYGKIVDCYIVRSRLTKLSRGYGYVDFYREYSAEDALDDGAKEPHMIHGRYITLRYASVHAAENRTIHGSRKPYYWI